MGSRNNNAPHSSRIHIDRADEERGRRLAAGSSTLGHKKMSIIELNGIGHAYLGRTILDDINLSVDIGEIVALVGPSGCGKSTLAHIAAGLLEPRSGKIKRAYSRHGVIFQEPFLMPWATAESNIAYSLKLAGISKHDRRERVLHVTKQVALESEDLQKYPIELSGGMKQRVAIARALVVQPDFIFFDEPFTALDVALKRRMQDIVIKACSGKNLAGLFITHDLIEAYRLADKIAVLDPNGRGITGVIDLPSKPGHREDKDIFIAVQSALETNPIFQHIHEVDERRVS